MHGYLRLFHAYFDSQWKVSAFSVDCVPWSAGNFVWWAYDVSWTVSAILYF